MIAKFLVDILNRRGCGPGPKTVEVVLVRASQGDFKGLLQLLEWRMLGVA